MINLTGLNKLGLNQIWKGQIFFKINLELFYKIFVFHIFSLFLMCGF